MIAGRFTADGRRVAREGATLLLFAALLRYNGREPTWNEQQHE